MGTSMRIALIGLSLSLAAIQVGACSGDSVFAAKDSRADGDWNDDYEPVPGGDGAEGEGEGEGEGEELPPEIEETANFKVPRGSGRFVFVPDETNDAVVVVDSETLNLEVVPVGSHPTHVVPLGDENVAAVINIGSDEVTILRAAPGQPTQTAEVAVRPDTNALAATSDGAHVVAYWDPRLEENHAIPSTDQEITVISTRKGQERAYHMTVGMHPWDVVFDEKGATAFVLTESGINVIDLRDLEDKKIPRVVSPFESGSFDPHSADLEISPDGSTVLARKDGEASLVVASLEESGDSTTYALPSPPTDLDVAPDGSYGMMVLRATSQIAYFALPLDDDEPFEFLDLGDALVGVASIASDSQTAVAYTTLNDPENSIDTRRLITLFGFGAEATVRSVVLERGIHSVALSPDSGSAVVVHDPAKVSGQSPYAYTLVALPQLQVKLQNLATSPGQLLLTPAGDFGFLLMPSEIRSEIIDLRSFIVDSLDLGSVPTAAGYAQTTNKVFISQDHPAGRMTFVDLADGSTKTLTGYRLNDEIEY